MAKNQHVRDFLDHYCTLERPSWAVMLSGQWGSGKSWFINNYIEHHAKDAERFIYISLNGIENFGQIESELFARLHPILGSKAARTTGRILRGALKFATTIDVFGADVNVDGAIPNEKVLSSITLKADHILVLDDLERSLIPVPALLGYFNQFIEHSGVKAIILANETEIVEPEDKSGAHRFALIKEKVIGRTFKVVPEVDEAMADFANCLPSGLGRDVAKRHLSLNRPGFRGGYLV
jgi:hypothetical protein